MNELNVYKQTLKMLLFTVLAIFLCRITKGMFTPVFVFAGVWMAFVGEIGWSLVFFVLMPFFIILNPGLLPKSNFLAVYSLRFGPLLIGLLLAMFSSRRKGHHRLPLGSIVPFLCAAVVSSMTGWAPYVSYMKLTNFLVFLLGIWYGTQNLQNRPKDVFILRSFLLALAVILVFGSILVMPFPSISYATSLQYAMERGGVGYAEEVFRTMKSDGVRTLFCGVTNHSQALAPVLSCILAWVFCDMLFIEKRFRILHVGLILCTFPLLYMTRSRVALIALVYVILIVFFYTARRIQLPFEVKKKLGRGLFFLLLLIVAIGMAVQLRSGAMVHWLRKTDENTLDRRSLREAITESRLGLIESSMYEFKRSPLVGSGFQVAEYTREMVKRAKGLIVSSPIEKGVLPVMVLGETGIIGIVLFFVFLLSFFWTCSRRRYYVTITTFSVLLVTNFGEATFFSPGGIGGILWMICVVGGFTIDTTILYRRNLESQWAAMAAADQMRREMSLAEKKL